MAMGHRSCLLNRLELIWIWATIARFEVTLRGVAIEDSVELAVGIPALLL
jgi:hypothetical protein